MLPFPWAVCTETTRGQPGHLGKDPQHFLAVRPTVCLRLLSLCSTHRVPAEGSGDRKPLWGNHGLHLLFVAPEAQWVLMQYFLLSMAPFLKLPR